MLVHNVLDRLFGSLLHVERDLRVGERTADPHIDRLQDPVVGQRNARRIVDRLVKAGRAAEVHGDVAQLEVERLGGHPTVAHGKADRHVTRLDAAQLVVLEGRGQRIKCLEVLDLDVLRPQFARGGQRPEVGRKRGVERRREVE